ncbi:MAG: hypothetical protein ABEI75_03520, partial [Halobaculum sp.]
AKNSVRLDVPGFGGRVPDAPSVSAALSAVETGPSEPAAATTGRTGQLGFRSVFVVATEIGTGRQRRFDSRSPPVELGAGEFLVRIDANIRVFVRFSGPARLHQNGSDRSALSFDEAKPVSIGFESRVELPDHTVTVAPTPAGAAAAVTASAATISNTSPDRTWPTQRDHPPTVELGDTTHVPDALRERRPDTGIQVTVPPQFDYVFTVGPLARYLGARVVTAAGSDPHVSVDGTRVPLGRLPETESRTADLLQRVFYLDCVARGAGPHGEELAVADVFDTLGLDADSLYTARMAERVCEYLDAPFERVRDRFPDWHLAMYVDPSADHLPSLPYLLDDLPLVCLPRYRDLDKKDWLRLTVGDGFEPPQEQLTDGGYRVRREISNVNLVEPELRAATSHGWMAQKVPIDVFKTFPEAYENRFDYLDGDESALQVTAVVNDRNAPLLLADDGEEAMRDEHAAAITHYRDRSEELPMDVTVRENVTTAELARIFESRNDLVHYIGHRDDRGLECANGYFSADTLDTSNTQTFFLNACGSYPEGKALVRKGSVGGGITYERVGNEDAATVGVTFARMLMEGFCIDRAVAVSSRQLLTPKDYAVVGDGTHVVAQSDSIVPPMMWLSDDGDEYELVINHGGPRMPGLETRGTFDECAHLSGQFRVHSLSHDRLVEYLDIPDNPIVYDGELFWPEELRRRLS